MKQSCKCLCCLRLFCVHGLVSRSRSRSRPQVTSPVISLTATVWSPCHILRQIQIKLNATLCKIPMSETPEPISGDSCATVSTQFEPLRCFCPSGRFPGSGLREVSGRERSLQGRGKKGGGTKLWKSSRILPKTSSSAGGPDGGSACRCPGNPRALFTSIGALSSRDRCEGEVTNSDGHNLRCKASS